jgi:hypothetical protein
MDHCKSCERRPDVTHRLRHGYCVICWRRLKSAAFGAFSRKG